MDKESIAKLKYLRIAPRKARAVANLVRGLPVNEAMARLMMQPRKPSIAILKLLKSAIANAKNQKLEETKLFIKEIRVDNGPKFKRWMPRARGGASPIEKKTSHVTIVLGISEKMRPSRFIIKEKPKKERVRKEKEKPKEEKPEITSVAKPVKAPGFFQKFFRRKSI